LKFIKKVSGPWAIVRDYCLYCDRDTIEYAYFNDGRNVVRRYCESEKCKQKAMKGVRDSVRKGSSINPSYAGINTRLNSFPQTK